MEELKKFTGPLSWIMVFEDDNQVMRFLKKVQEFEKNDPNWKEEESVEQLSINNIPTGMVPLEVSFNRDDAFK